MKKNQRTAISSNPVGKSVNEIAKVAAQSSVSFALQSRAANEAEAPVFKDPRSNLDRRQRQSVFFKTLRERRRENRRITCSLSNDWWIRRNYYQDQTQQ